MGPLDSTKDVFLKVDSLLQGILVPSRLNLTYTLASHPGSRPELLVRFDGADVPHLLARNAELLLALEHVAAKALALEPEDHDAISFDAAGFKAARDRTLERAAGQGVTQVRQTGQPHHFPPMNSRERRLLHLTLSGSGLTTQSEGDGAMRHLVLYPRSG